MLNERPILLSALALLCATSASGASAEQTPYTLAVATLARESTPWVDQLMALQARVEAESDGRLRLRVFPGGTSAVMEPTGLRETDLVRSLEVPEGRFQGALVATSTLDAVHDVPVLRIPELPFLLDTGAEADLVLDDLLREPAEAALGERGLTLGAWSETGWRGVITRGRPADSPTAFSGLRLRVEQPDLYRDTVRALGATPVQRSTRDALPHFKLGHLDGVVATPFFALAAGWIEPATHFTRTDHSYLAAAVVFSTEALEDLPSDLRALLLDGWRADSEAARAQVRAMEPLLLERIEAKQKVVVDLTPAHREALREKSLPVHQAFLQDHPDLEPLYHEVQARLSAHRDPQGAHPRRAGE
ncbi:MAG: TRAP transporter substrate-binding protein [Alphaproteobacteria bacterium]|nr:TRAP transporter substrate-binding protein [Alphaproteobacteria bacterium]